MWDPEKILEFLGDLHDLGVGLFDPFQKPKDVSFWDGGDDK